MIVVTILLVAALLAALPLLLVGAAVIAVLGILGAVLSGVAVLLVAAVYVGKGILPGMALGYIAYRAIRKARTAGRA